MRFHGRPSVDCHSAEIFTLVSAPRQPSSRSGFPSGAFGKNVKTLLFLVPLLIHPSTKSGFVTRAVKSFDAGYHRRVRRYVSRFGRTFTPVLRGYESAAVGRSGLRGKEPQYEPRHGHGACPRTAKARPANAVPPPMISSKPGLPAAYARAFF